MTKYAINAGWVSRTTRETGDMHLVGEYSSIGEAKKAYKGMGPEEACESPYVKGMLGKPYGMMLGHFSIMTIELEEVTEDDNGFEDYLPLESKRVAYIYEGQYAPEMDEWSLSPDDESDREEFRDITEDWESEVREFRDEFLIDQDNIDLELSHMWTLTGKNFEGGRWYECTDGSHQSDLGEGCVWDDLAECEARKRKLEADNPFGHEYRIDRF